MDVASPLPEDVLTLIFQHISAAETFHDRYLEDIIHVCRRWRAVALSHALLWARIIVDIEPDNPTGLYDGRAGNISQRVSRSGTAPLAIEISLEHFFDTHCSDPTCKCQDSDFDYGYFEPRCYNTVKYFDQARRLIRFAVGEAGEHMARWSYLSINFEPRHFDFGEGEVDNMYLLQDIKYPTPILKVLSLHGVEGSFKSLLPSLPYLSHYEFAINGRITDLNVPWSSLKSFAFSQYSEYTDRAVFSHITECTSLEGLYITNSAQWLDGTMEGLRNTNPFNCTLPSLSSLELLCPIPFDMSSFKLPSLTHLTLAIPESFGDPQKRTLEAKMQRVQRISTMAANTRILKLLHINLDTQGQTESWAPKDKLAEMFRYMPKLEEISVASALYLCISDVLRKDLNIVPHLERIVVITDKGLPILISGMDFMLNAGCDNWRVGIPLSLPGIVLLSALKNPLMPSIKD
jgi:hypothetical protein